jgi:hypothetical protein
MSSIRWRLSDDPPVDGPGVFIGLRRVGADDVHEDDDY